MQVLFAYCNRDESFLLNSGLRKLIFGNLGYAFGELYRGINSAAQVKILQKFVPSLEVSDVERYVI